MQIQVHGTPTALEGKTRHIGSEAPAVRVMKCGNEELIIGMMAPKPQLIMSLPSLKTEVCSLGAKRLDEILKRYDGVVGTLISTDDIEVLERFEKEAQIKHMRLVHDHEGVFGKKYGIKIHEGKLKGRLARALFLINEEGVIVYQEIVNEVTDSFNEAGIIDAVKTCLAPKKGHHHESWMG